jgi:hypothetical protein
VTSVAVYAHQLWLRCSAGHEWLAHLRKAYGFVEYQPDYCPTCGKDACDE